MVFVLKLIISIKEQIDYNSPKFAASMYSAFLDHSDRLKMWCAP